MVLNMEADIIPGTGAAGLRLGTAISAVLQDYGAVFSADVLYDALGRPSGHRYRSSSVDLWSHDGTMAQIMVQGTYRGRLARVIGLGATIADVEAAIGPCAEDDEDNLIITTLPGVCLEISATYADPAWRHAPIVEIYVFRA
jgi:hypothetical protein